MHMFVKPLLSHRSDSFIMFSRIAVIDENVGVDIHKLKKKVRDGDDPSDVLLLGLLYLTGNGIARNPAKAEVLIRRAAEAGYPKACHVLGITLRDGTFETDPVGSHMWILRAAEGGVAEAQMYAGIDLHNGDGVMRDDHAALMWLERSLENGCEDSRYFIGNLRYFSDDETIRDRDLGMSLLNAASDNGDRQASMALCSVYANGTGVERNMFMAEMMLRRAAAQGDADACHSLSRLYAAGTPHMEKDMGKSFEMLVRAVELGCTDALQDLGAAYMYGLGTGRDMGMAIRYLREAADNGSPKALVNLGLIYSNGMGVRKDEHRAVELYTRAVGMGDSTAMSNLGVMYAMGAGVRRDVERARELWTKAADLGNLNAVANLCVLEGLDGSDPSGVACRVDLGRGPEVVELGNGRRD